MFLVHANITLTTVFISRFPCSYEVVESNDGNWGLKEEGEWNGMIRMGAG